MNIEVFLQIFLWFKFCTSFQICIYLPTFVLIYTLCHRCCPTERYINTVRILGDLCYDHVVFKHRLYLLKIKKTILTTLKKPKTEQQTNHTNAILLICVKSTSCLMNTTRGGLAIKYLPGNDSYRGPPT